MTSELEQWDITSSVGLTALGVAAGRAMESHRPDRLINDPFAEAFVETAAPPAPLPTRPEQAADDSSKLVWGIMADFIALRTRFFDDYFAEASAAGIDQVVLLAAGLDTRALRLQWPSTCTLYEVDQDKVLAFKQEVLEAQNAEPQCIRRLVPTDLRDDWVGELRSAGFDPKRPTAWLAEGLLPYLPGEAEENLFDRIHALSAAGSRIAIEHTPNIQAMQENPLFETASDSVGIDVRSLWSTEPRRDSVGWLDSQGWSVRKETLFEIGARYQRTLHDEMREIMNEAALYVAEKPSA